MVLIPLEFRDPWDIRSLWRVASFKYLDGLWEWVQVRSHHVVNHYTMLTIQCTAKLVRGVPQNRVSIITPPTECSWTINLPLA